MRVKQAVVIHKPVGTPRAQHASRPSVRVPAPAASHFQPAVSTQKFTNAGVKGAHRTSGRSTRIKIGIDSKKCCPVLIVVCHIISSTPPRPPAPSRLLMTSS